MTSKTCPPCNGNCRQGRDCPAEQSDDPLAPARGIVVGIIASLAVWATLAIGWCSTR